MAEWTFLTLHAAVLGLIANNPRIKGTELSSELSVTERTIRKIIADLCAAGYITIHKEGRGNRYEINHDQKLRADTHRGQGHSTQDAHTPGA